MPKTMSNSFEVQFEPCLNEIKLNNFDESKDSQCHFNSLERDRPLSKQILLVFDWSMASSSYYGGKTQDSFNYQVDLKLNISLL